MDKSSIKYAAAAGALLALLLFSGESRASDEQRFVGFECDADRQMLRLSYHTASLHVDFNEGLLIDTFFLKKNDPSGENVESIRTVTKQCMVGKLLYVVHIRGIPGNWRLNGVCGALTFAGVRVMQNDQQILDVAFDSCQGDEVTESITYTGSAESPMVRKVNSRK